MIQRRTRGEFLGRLPLREVKEYLPLAGLYYHLADAIHHSPRLSVERLKAQEQAGQQYIPIDRGKGRSSLPLLRPELAGMIWRRRSIVVLMHTHCVHFSFA